MTNYIVTINFPNGTCNELHKPFSDLHQAITLFDKTDFFDFVGETNFPVEEIEIKKFVDEEITPFESSEVPESHIEFVKTGWFVKLKA